MEQQALATHRTNERFGPLCVAHLAISVPEIELGQIAMQVSFADAVERAVHAALNEGEERLNGVRRSEAALADILVGGVAF